MRFIETPIRDLWEIELEPRGDSRGFFARVFCRKIFQERGLVGSFVQVNNSLSTGKATLRGMHYQLPPAAETKLVRCIRGQVWDCALDLRPESPTFGKWHACVLADDNRKMLYIPKGFAHGFISLTEDSELLYMVDEYYSPEQERGIRWDDPRFAIEWPLPPSVISDRDRSHPDYGS